MNREKAKVISWDNLIKRLEKQWNKSRTEVHEQLVVTIRYAIFTSLDSIKVLSGLLVDQAKAPEIQDWAKECHQICLNWIDSYWKIQESCSSRQSEKEPACKCILEDVNTLLANSINIYSQGISIPDNEVKSSQVREMLFEKLFTVTQIYKQLQAQDSSWLLQYIEYEDELRESD